MSSEFFISYCLEKKGAAASYPFGPDTLVIKVANKMFALFGADKNTDRINLKCDPEDAQALRKQYAAITPAYHMNKQHWNSVLLDDSLPKILLEEMIDHSYELVVKGLPRKQREQLLA